MNVTCNICGSCDYELLFNRSDNVFGEQTIIKCKNCAVVYTYPMPDEDSLSKHYDGHFFTEKFDFIGSGKIWERFYRLNLAYIEKQTMKRRILEVGCGLGHFLNVAKRRGWDVQGVELSKFAADYAVNKFNLKIHNHSIKELSFPDNYFDVVVLWATLEHLVDPFKKLCEINKILSPGGLLALSVPNHNSLDTKLNGMQKTDMKYCEHLYHFPLNTLKMLLEKTGFKDMKRMVIFGGSPEDTVIGDLLQFLARILDLGSETRVIAYKK